MLLGVAAGGVVRLSGLATPLRFSPSAFFYGLLPPIVFAAGVTLKKRSFFANIGTVLLFAVVGTAVSTLVFGLATYALVLLRVVKRKHLGPQPLIECMLFGEQMVVSLWREREGGGGEVLKKCFIFSRVSSAL